MEKVIIGKEFAVCKECDKRILTDEKGKHFIIIDMFGGVDNEYCSCETPENKW